MRMVAAEGTLAAATVAGFAGAVLLGVVLASLPLPLAVGLVLGPLILLLLLRFPLLALGLMLLVGPWGALENAILGNAVLDSGQLSFLLLVSLWLARGVVRRRAAPPGARRGIVIPYTPLNLPLLLFLAVAILSLPSAPSPAAGLKELLKWIEMAAVMWIVIDLAQTKKGVNLWAVVAVVLVAGLSQALIGIWQFGLRADGPEHFLIGNLLPLGEFYRAYGTFEQPNPFGAFVSWHAVLGIGAMIGWGMHWWGRRSTGFSFWSAGRSFQLLLLAVATGASGLALLMSWSRGAWLGFAAGMGALTFFWPRRWQRGALLLLGALIVLALAWQGGLIPAPVTARLSSFTADLRLGDVRGADINDANYSVLERLAHWQAALSMARSNLWLGVGFGNYEAAYATFALLSWPYPLGHAHNYYLNLLAETGVLGLIAYLAFWATVFWQTLRLSRRSPWPARGLILGLMGLWVAFSTHHLLDKLYVNNLYLHLGVMLGILQLLERRGKDKGSK